MSVTMMSRLMLNLHKTASTVQGDVFSTTVESTSVYTSDGSMQFTRMPAATRRTGDLHANTRRLADIEDWRGEAATSHDIELVEIRAIGRLDTG